MAKFNNNITSGCIFCYHPRALPIAAFFLLNKVGFIYATVFIFVIIGVLVSHFPKLFEALP